MPETARHTTLIARAHTHPLPAARPHTLRNVAPSLLHSCQPRAGTSMTSTSITAFFKPKPTEPEPEMLHWKTMKKITGTTSCVEVHLKARVGATVTHTVHGKVKLVGQPTPGKLEIEIEKINIDNYRNNWKSITREIVDAALCSNPTALARARDPSVYLQENDNTRTIQAKMKAVRKARFLLEPTSACLQQSGHQKRKSKRQGEGGLDDVVLLEHRTSSRPQQGRASERFKGQGAAQVAWLHARAIPLGVWWHQVPGCCGRRHCHA